jgi:ribonuclease R
MILDERKDRILSFMRDYAYKPLLFSELSVVLDVPHEDIPILQAMLDQMEEEGLILKTKKGRYGVPERMSLIVGKFQGHAKGFGFVLPDLGGEDVFIPANALNGAMNGDKVISRLTRHSSNDRHQEGEIIKVLQRANKTVVGKFDRSDNFGFVTPDHVRLSGDIFIAKDLTNGAEKGQKVVVEITKWPEANRNAEGKIIEILGDAHDTGVDVMSIIRAYGIPYEFPDEVIKEAQAVPNTVTEANRAGRRDLRSLRMVTIDGEDARDLDDAVSIEMLENGIYRLGVHIADVTHYVTEGSALNEEALRRGTSVYFPDRVIPMLPQQLSNGICSLNAGVDRLAFSVIIDVDPNGAVVDHDIFESVIHVRERMTYTNVYKILEENDAALMERYKDHLEDFQLMKELALILKAKRKNRGAVDFDFDEAKVIVDETGKPVEIKRYKLTLANNIIEEFMLLCNEVVSEHFFWLGVPFVYRIHEDPDPEKMENLNQILGTFGYKLKGYRDVHPRALQEIVTQIKGTPEEKTISMLMLRSMSKARYSDVHDWHFGLAAEYYSHFTSPIRRYPDLIIHRIMKEQINGMLNDNRIEHYKEILPEITRSNSERERAAQDAERDCIDLKKAEYMMDKVGQEFVGTISNVTAFGMFVELDNTIEGLVRLSTMEDDYYIYDERSLSLLGERTKRRYRIGETVKVQLVKASPEARQIDFMLIDDKDKTDDAQNKASGAIEELKASPIRKRKNTVEPHILVHIGANKKKNTAHKKEMRKKSKEKRKHNREKIEL